MMSEAIIIWLYLSLGNLVNGFIITSIIGGIVLPFIMLIMWAYEEDEKLKLTWIYAPKKTFLVLLLLYLFYPSKDDLKYIIGGAVAWNGIEAAQDIEGVEKLPENVVGAMNHFLEEFNQQEEK